MSNPSSHALEGGCFCGAIRYRADGPVSYETICHCSICRRTSAAPAVAWFTVATTSYAVTKGEPSSSRSSDHGTRTFCSRCGTPLTFRSTNTSDEIDITTCSLDDPERVPPKDQTRTSSKLSWIHLDDTLPAFIEGRGEQ